LLLNREGLRDRARRLDQSDATGHGTPPQRDPIKQAQSLPALIASQCALITFLVARYNAQLGNKVNRQYIKRFSFILCKGEKN